MGALGTTLKEKSHLDQELQRKRRKRIKIAQDGGTRDERHKTQKEVCSRKYQSNSKKKVSKKCNTIWKKRAQEPRSVWAMFFWPTRGRPTCLVHLDGVPLPMVPQYRYLGIVLTPCLSWRAHVAYLCARGDGLFHQPSAWCHGESPASHFCTPLCSLRMSCPTRLSVRSALRVSCPTRLSVRSAFGDERSPITRARQHFLALFQ